MLNHYLGFLVEPDPREVPPPRDPPELPPRLTPEDDPPLREGRVLPPVRPELPPPDGFLGVTEGVRGRSLLEGRVVLEGREESDGRVVLEGRVPTLPLFPRCTFSRAPLVSMVLVGRRTGVVGFVITGFRIEVPF